MTREVEQPKITACNCVMPRADIECIRRTPEQRIADKLASELGVHIDAQALRIFIRTHWKVVSACAHAIHDAGAAQ